MATKKQSEDSPAVLKPVFTVTTDADIFEPTLLKWIRAGTSIELTEVSPWLQAQIDNSNGVVRFV